MTSSLPPSSQAIFWRQSLAAIQPTIKAEWQWVVGIGVLWAALQIFSLGFIDPLDLQLPPKPDLQQLLRCWPLFAALTAPAIPVTYIYSVLFMRLAKEGVAPVLSLSGFCFWLAKGLQKYLLICLPGLLIAIIGVVIVLLAFANIDTDTASLVECVLCFAWMAIYYYLLFRFSLVTPLAIIGGQPVLKKSWDMTKGQVWRILSSFLTQLFALVLIFSVPFVVCLAIRSAVGIETLQAYAISSLYWGAWEAIVCLAGAIYYCTVYRGLVQEKNEINPKQNSILT